MPEEYGLDKHELDVLQADIDDESPQVLSAFIERALREGALDAHLTPLIMKKGRPGVRLEVLCKPEDREKFLRLIVTETSTLGVKARRIDRYALKRGVEEILLHGERVRIKIAYLDNQAIRATPEYEDCRAIAEKKRLPIRNVLQEAKQRAQLIISNDS